MSDERRSPLVGQVILFVVFLALATVGVFTVVIPELTSDDPDETAEEAEPTPDEAPEDDAE